MIRKNELTRRDFLCRSGVAGAGLVLSGWAGTAQGQTRDEKSEDIGPVEDLMREHGVLRRVFLIYEEGVRRVKSGQELPKLLINRAAEMVRRFVEEYHERLEEKYLFPRFKGSKTLGGLVEVLQVQHEKGRLLTEGILKSPHQAKTAEFIGEFIRMYRPHAAREDTVLFPALHQVLGEKEFDTLGDQFEKIEQERFGKNGFEKMVDQVAVLEKELGIYDLAKFTPSI